MLSTWSSKLLWRLYRSDIKHGFRLNADMCLFLPSFFPCWLSFESSTQYFVLLFCQEIWLTRDKEMEKTILSFPQSSTTANVCVILNPK
jgi:hypothetical protein